MQAALKALAEVASVNMVLPDVLIALTACERRETTRGCVARAR